MRSFYSRNNAAFSKAILFIALSIFSYSLSAQSVQLKGIIVDQKGLPAEGVSIQVKGTRSGAASDAEGRFRVNVIPPATLIFSGVSYKIQERNFSLQYFKDSASREAIVYLESNGTSAELEAVTVGALGVRTSHKSYGYASSSVTSSTVSKGRNVTVSRALSGKTSGLVTGTSTASAAPKIILRGLRSVTTTEETDIKKEKTDIKKETKSLRADETRDTITKVAVEEPISKSKLLTAGEVNDFKKWKLWEDYSKKDFESYSRKWDLYTKQRYSVQLQNGSFKAITQRTVYLLNSQTGDTLWTAVSDNTGKAELWAGFRDDVTKNDLVIAVANEKAVYPATPFVQGINRIVVKGNCGGSSKVEIVFLTDATGSMGDEIDYLKEELNDVLEKVAAKEPTLNFSTGAVFYRDRGDEYLTRTEPLSTGITHTINFIQQQQSGGGGDTPESMNVGLDSAVNGLHWSDDARAKIIFLLMDAPPHDDAKAQMQKLIEQAAAKGIRIVPIACSGTDKATEFIMRSIALATNGTYLFLTDDSGIGNPHIKPTTDEFKVELLNDLLQRVIEQMIYVVPCDEKAVTKVPLAEFENRKNVLVYPNPTNGPVTVETYNRIKEFFITDFTGKILKRIDAKKGWGTFRVDLSAYPSGTYLVKYFTIGGVGGTEKVVLMH